MHPLEAKIRAVRRRLRYWLLVDGLARLAVCVLGAAMILGTADYWFRFQEPGLRAIVSLVFFALVGWGLYQLGVSPAWKRIPEVALALRLERCFPALSDRLASSVAFLWTPAEDSTAGSPALRELVIAQTVQEAATVDFQSALDPRPILRSVLGAGALLAAAGTFALIAPDAARIALVRLAAPFTETAWPQRTHLILVRRVERIGRGDPFELLVEETKGNLPADLRIHYRLETPDGVQQESEPIRPIPLRTETGQWKQVGRVRREGLLRPFWYRVTGGDDTTMDWIRVEVLTPPSLVHCQVRVIPPEYTGLPTETAGQWIRALVGSRVEISGRADRPLQSAAILTDDEQLHPAQILPDGHSFQIGIEPLGGAAKQGAVPEGDGSGSAGKLAPGKTSPAGSETPGRNETVLARKDGSAGRAGGLFIRQSGRWRLRLIDREGMEHEAASWEVRAAPDLPPSITVESPPVLTYATPSATLPVRVKGKDDLGIHRVVLLATASVEAASEEPTSPRRAPDVEPEKPPPADLRPWVLYEGPTPPPRQAKSFSAGGDLSPPLPAVQYTWDLGTLQAQAGMQIVFYVQASDYAGQTASSQPHRIVLLTPQQFLERLNAQQNVLLAELDQWRQKQRSLHEQLADLLQSLAKDQPFGQRQLDRLRSLELLQRQLHSQLARSPESVLSRLETLLADVANNHLYQTDFQRRLEYLRTGLGQLEQEHLTAIAQQFIQGIKAAQARLETNASGTTQPPQTTLDSLGQVLAHQEAVLRSLESWLKRFRPGLQTQRLSQEMGQLIRDQEAIWGQIRRIAQTTLTKEVRELGAQELADLESASQRQTELARRMEQLRQEMADLLQQLPPQDTISAHLLNEAIRYADQTSLAAVMRTAGQDILQNRMGQLFQSVPQIVRDLEHIADLLANRQSQTLTRTLPLLDQTEQALAELIKTQQEVHALLESAARQKPTDQAALLQQAAREQEALIARLRKVLEQAEQLWSAQASQAIRTALEAMEQTARSARQAAPTQAIQTSQAALQALQQARQLLAEERLQLQAALLGQQLAQLREALPGLQQRQEKLWKETSRLIDVQKNTGTLSSQDQFHLADLARQQQELHAQTHSWVEKLADGSVVQTALAEAAQWMQQAAQELARTQPGPAQTAQQEALAQIRLLLEALSPETSLTTLPKEVPAERRPSAGAGARTLVSAAELKLLRLWQQSVHQRTLAFHQTFGDAPPDRPEVRAQYESLRQAQARLAQMVEQILRSASSENPKP